jgi:hypothetical protein
MRSNTGRHTRRILSLALMLLMVTHLVPVAFGEDSVASRIAAMSTGAKIEVRLTNKQRMRGVRGPVSNSGFTLIDAVTGGHQIAFADVVSVKQFTTKSHVTRNVLIGVAIGVAALGITFAVLISKARF